MTSPAHTRLWMDEHLTIPDIYWGPDGVRLVRWAGEYISTNPDYLRSHGDCGYDGILQEDGTLQLDDAGEWRYRPLERPVLPWGFTAYQRITEDTP